MSITKTLIIKQLSRFPKTGDFDELNFNPGVNVLVGKSSTGKTQWLRMLNFLMGDRDSNPANAFDINLVKKYDSVKGIFIIGDDEVTLERKWKESGHKGKVFINGEPISADKFSPYLLSLLNIPSVHFPQGNPLSPRTWPELSWQSLLRHIYRRQLSWGELVSKQPEVDQHACILLFVGIAEYLFSPESKELAEKQKEIYKQEVRKEEFVSTLNQISRELLSDRGLGVAVTAISIESAIDNLNIEVDNLLTHRTEILNSLRDNLLQELEPTQTVAFLQLSERWAQLHSSKNEILDQIQLTQSRLKDLKEYNIKLEDEWSRIERAKSAGQIFRDLRVTHCPVCEQTVDPKKSSHQCCYLCGQPNVPTSNESNASEQRLDFEIEQLNDEKQEANELVGIVNDELSSLLSRNRDLEEEITSIQSQIRPNQVAAAAILPPEISQIDMNLGRIQESTRQLERIKDALKLQENLSDKISQTEKEISSLEIETAIISQEISFEIPSSFIADRMNTYLNSIKLKNLSSWSQGEIRLKLRDKGFNFTVSSKGINSISATMMLYFLASYNYALLALSNKEKYHYPGLSILDFPPTFADGSLRTDSENIILEPFIDLVNQPDMKNTQVIAVGSAFHGLQNVHKD